MNTFTCFLGHVTLLSSSENSVPGGRFHKLVAESFLAFRGSRAKTDERRNGELKKL